MSQPQDLAPAQSGKVRDIYDLGDELLLVATDRISAFDVVLPDEIPHKGEVLTRLSLFWFDRLADIVPNHYVSTDVSTLPDTFQPHAAWLAGRSTIVRRADVFPVECIVRGYITGSGWNEYLQSGSVCGHELPDGLLESQKLDEVIFTPSTKATIGHDVNISVDEMNELVGAESGAALEEASIALYTAAAAHARERGIIIADTKFEFGLVEGELTLVDEVLTPDSSRFWPVDGYEPGHGQPSFDKQYVRDWLLEIGWDKHPPAPRMPEGVVEQTSAKYVQAYETITGETFVPVGE